MADAAAALLIAPGAAVPAGTVLLGLTLPRRLALAGRRAGFDVRTAENGRVGLARHLEDVQRPQRVGHEIATRFHQRRRDRRLASQVVDDVGLRHRFEASVLVGHIGDD